MDKKSPHLLRFKNIDILHGLAIIILLGFLLAPQTTLAITGTLTIPGTGDSTNLLRALGHVFEAKNPGTQIIIPDSIGSSGGLKMLRQKETNLARIARPLSEADKALGLTAVPFALSPIVFVVNEHANQLTNVSMAQIIKIYDGSLTKWRELHVDLETIYPITREEGDSSLEVIKKFAPKLGTANNKIAKTIYSTPKTVRTLLRYKQTIGFIPMSAALGTDLHILAINNIYPSLDNVQSGKYKYVVQLSLVHRAPPSPLEQSFIAFLTNLDSLQVIFKNGAIPTM